MCISFTYEVRKIYPMYTKQPHACYAQLYCRNYNTPSTTHTHTIILSPHSPTTLIPTLPFPPTTHTHTTLHSITFHGPLSSLSTALFTLPRVRMRACRLASASPKPMSCSCCSWFAYCTAGSTAGAAGVEKGAGAPVCSGCVKYGKIC